MFILILSNEDGETRIEQLERDVLLKRLNEGYWGDLEFVTDLEDVSNDPAYWGRRALLVEGQLVAPRPEQTVTSWTL